MEKKTKIVKIFFPYLLIGALLLSSASFVFAEEKADLVKNYTFYSEDYKNPKYDAPKEIEEKGKKYELKNISYRVLNEPIEVTKHVKLKDKNEAELSVTENINGKDITLTANPAEIEWKETKEETTVKSKEYKSRSSIPKSIKSTKTDSSGNNVDITLTLTETKNISKTEKFSAPAKFYSPAPNGKLYMFNGKKVSITGDLPVWSGYKEDVKNYLGLNGNTYSITGGSWTSEAVKEGDRYVRTASFTGTKQIPLYRATFTETADTAAATYEADITYADSRGYEIKAVAEYDEVNNLIKYIAIGAGLLILILAAVAIIYMLSKKGKRKENSIQ